MTDPVKRAGIHERVVPGRDQRYTIAVPSGYTAEEAAPLVVALHWAWQGIPAPFYGKDILVSLAEPGLRELGAIVAAPDCLYRDWAMPESEAAIRGLIEHLQGEYAIDARKIALTGYSRGGRGTWYLAARNQDLFSLAIPIAGRPQPDPADVEWRIPLYVIHSRQDELVPFADTERVVGRLRARGVAIEFVPVEGVTHYEAERLVQPLREAVPWIRKAWGA